MDWTNKEKEMEQEQWDGEPVPIDVVTFTMRSPMPNYIRKWLKRKFPDSTVYGVQIHADACLFVNGCRHTCECWCHDD